MLFQLQLGWVLVRTDDSTLRHVTKSYSKEIFKHVGHAILVATLDVGCR